MEMKRYLFLKSAARTEAEQVEQRRHAHEKYVYVIREVLRLYVSKQTENVADFSARIVVRRRPYRLT